MESGQGEGEPGGWQGTMRRRKGGQRSTVPGDPLSPGSPPGPGSRRNSLRISPRNTKSSARASPSPGHDRAPQPNGSSDREGAPGARNRSGGDGSR